MKLHDLRAKDLMTPDVITIEPLATLREAARALDARHVHCLVVPGSDPTRCAGVLTIKDLVQVLCEADPAALDELVVEDVMSSPAFTLQQDFAIDDCLKLMRRGGVRSAPVLDGAKLVGLLSFTDVIRVIATGG